MKMKKTTKEVDVKGSFVDDDSPVVIAAAIHGGDHAYLLPALADASDCDTTTSSSTSYSDSNFRQYKKYKSKGRLRKEYNHSSTTLDIQPVDGTTNDNSKTTNSKKSTDTKRPFAFCLGSLFLDLLSWGEKEEEEEEEEEEETFPDALNVCPRNTGMKAVQKQSEDTNTEEVSNNNNEHDLQKWMEMDIMNLLGCTGGIEEISSYHLCNECYIMVPSELETQQVPTQQKLTNRSTFKRQKARERIQILRNSGLSRNFSWREISLLSRNNIIHDETRIQIGCPRNGKCSCSQTAFTIGKSKTVDWSSLQKLKKKRCSSQRSEPRTCSKYTRCANNNNNNNYYYYYYYYNIARDLLVNCTVKPRIVHVEIADSTIAEPDIELCYDSDPGPEIVSGRSSTSNEHNNGRNRCTVVTPICDSLLQAYDINSFDLNDNIAVTQLVTEFIHGTYKFIWHPNNGQRPRNVLMEASVPSHPVVVKCWFELGSCLKTMLLHPKLYWKNISPIQVHSNDNCIIPQHIELLNIVRILTPIDVKRDTYPFVKRQNSFLITTNENEEFMFEAKTPDERDKFLFAMKLVIARLASKLIVGDHDVFREFFSFSGANVASNDEANEKRVNKERGNDISFVSGSVGSLCASLVSPVYEQRDRSQQLLGST